MTHETPHRSGASTNGRVAVLGSLNLDELVRVARLPRPGETVHATSTSNTPGGKGGNQAAATRRCGAETHFFGSIGDDAGGIRYLEHLRALDIGTAGVRMQSGYSTGSALVLVDDAAENSIIVDRGANHAAGDELLGDLQAFLRPGDVLLMQLEVPSSLVLEAARLAHDVGALTVLNPSPMHADIDDLIALAGVLIVNEIEASQLAEAVPSAKLCVTMGAAGATWSDVHMPAHAIEARDTTGAGDAFAGTLAAALAMGWSRQEALESAVAAATARCRIEGAQSWSSPGR